LWKEHEELRGIVQKALDSSDQKEQKTLFKQFVQQLCKHSIAEEIVIHPMLVKLGSDEKQGKSKDVESNLDKAVEQEHAMARILHEMIVELESKDKQWFNKSLMDAQKSLLEHMEHEEKNIFSLLESNLAKNEIDDLNNLYLKAKEIAPTEADPKGPFAAIEKLFKEMKGDKNDELTKRLEESVDIIGKSVKGTQAQGQVPLHQEQAPAQTSEKGKGEHHLDEDHMDVAAQKGTKREREETDMDTSKAAKKEESDSPRKVTEATHVK
jgi:hemerythrin superfamily protein